MIDKSNNEVLISHKRNNKKLEYMKEWIKSQDIPYKIDDKVIKLEECLVVSKLQITIISPFH